MQGEGGHPPYGHHVPMDLHVPQHFPYYAGCIMDNQAMFTAQQMQYNKMYAGIDPTGRRMEELAAQGSLNSRYGQHPILELRKEKSRDAARSRRGKENYEFYELAKMLPLPGAITSQLDKASIVRLTIAYLRLREFAAHGDPPWNRDGRFDGKLTLKGSALRRVHHPNHSSGLAMDMFEEHEGTHILQSLDGFAISLASDGRFLYISETVSIYLGLSQVELTGSSFFDYIHQSDHEELADQLGVTIANPMGGPDSPAAEGDEGAGQLGAAPPIPDVCYPVTSLMSNNKEDKHGKPNYDRAFCIRMKSTLTKRGCHFKSSGYRVVLMLGKIRPQYTYSTVGNTAGLAGKKQSPPIMGFIGLAIALPPPSVHEVRLETDMFVTRLGFDFKIAHCEPKVSELLDWTAEDLTGKSMYELVHAGDVDKIKQTHLDLIKKGQVMSHYYRLMNRRGGYTWMQICATLVCNNKNNDEQTIICVNYVISGSQYSHLVMDTNQVDQPAGVKPDDNEGSTVDACNDTPDSQKEADSADYSNHGSEGGREQHQTGHMNSNYYADQSDPAHLRLGQTSMATSNNGLKSPSSPEEKTKISKIDNKKNNNKDTKEENNQIEKGTNNNIKVTNTYSPQASTGTPSPVPPVTSPCYSPPTSTPTTSYNVSTVTDQNSNSVRDLENAMTKHLPKEKSAKDSSASYNTEAGSATSHHLLKQLYSRQSGYLPDIQSDSNDNTHPTSASTFSLQSYARLAAGSAGLAGPATPVPLKPPGTHIYSPATVMGHEPTSFPTAAFPSEVHHQSASLYSHPGVSSFHLYNRTAVLL